MTRRRPIWSSGYWFVLGLIVFSYVLCATEKEPNPGAVVLLVQLATVAVTLGISAERQIVRRVGWTVLAVASVAVTVVWLVGAAGHQLDIVLTGASMVAYLVAPVVIISHQLNKDSVDLQTLLAAIAAYLLVGMLFTFAYNFIALVTSTPTFGADHVDSLPNQLFFSFTTLTTTGYGNLVPANPGVQSMAIAEAITGQLFLVVAVASVVSGYQRVGRADKKTDSGEK